MPLNPILELPLDFTRLADPTTAGVAPAGLARLQAEFESFLDEGLHSGAQLVLARHGQVLLDLALGQRSRRDARPVTPETRFLTFSVTKPFTAACIHHLEQAGQVNLDAPVALYWREFGCKGKESATLRHVLTHQAGVPWRGIFRQVWSWADWEAVTRQVAELPAEFPPGTKTAYHTVNYGFILGEVIRRVSGLTVADYLQRHFLTPLGMQHTSLALPASWDAHCAGIDTGHASQALAGFIFNRPAVRHAVIPAATLHATARDLAVFYQMFVNQGCYAGQQLLAPETVQRATSLQSEGYDANLIRPMRWALGFHLGGQLGEHGPHMLYYGRRASTATFGHAGQGSCIAWGDPAAGLVLAFTCNRLLSPAGALNRWRRLGDAAWAALVD